MKVSLPLFSDIDAHTLEGVQKMPLHVRIREYLRSIVVDKFEDGDKFYTEPMLIEQLGVSQGTIRRALTDLAHEGLLVRKVPSGTFVRKTVDTLELRVIMPGCDSVFWMGVLDQILNDCQRRDLLVRIHHTLEGGKSTEVLRQFQGIPARQRVILLGLKRQEARALYVSLAKRGVRVVNIDTLAAGCGDAYVGVDNESGIRQGMDHLMALGHRRIVLLVNEPMEAGNIQARVRAFKEIVRTCRLANARVEECSPGFWHGEAAKRRLGELLASQPAPTAFFAVSDTGAWVTLKCLTGMGVAVPDEVSVLGFDDDRASAFMQPALSTLAQPIKAIVRQAIDLLTQTALPSGMNLLPPALVVRESTGRVAAAPKEKGERRK